MTISVRYVRKGDVLSPQAYTFDSDEALQVGDFVRLPSGAKGVVVATDVPTPEGIDIQTIVCKWPVA